jgi:hypothetical protein
MSLTVSPRKPIDIDIHTGDSALKASVGDDSLTLSGSVASGGYHPKVDGVEMNYTRGAPLNLTLDAKALSAPDRWGYRRVLFAQHYFSVDTHPKDTPLDVAKALANRINERGEFYAAVKPAQRDGSVEIDFTRG